MEPTLQYVYCVPAGSNSASLSENTIHNNIQYYTFLFKQTLNQTIHNNKYNVLKSNDRVSLVILFSKVTSYETWFSFPYILTTSGSLLLIPPHLCKLNL